MRNDFKDALHEYRWDLVATPIATVILAPIVHYAGAITWSLAVGFVVTPIVMMLAVKLLIEGWFGLAGLDTDDAELVEVHIDRRGRIRGSWRQRPHE